MPAPITSAELLDLARTLPLPVPWNRDKFVAGIAKLRGRPIRLVPVDTAALVGSPCGLWLARDDDDLILHEAGTSDYHIDHIVCHEVGHMVLGHGLDQLAEQPAAAVEQPVDPTLWTGMLADLDPATVRSVLGRTHFAAHQEHSAEMFANLVRIAAAEASDSRSIIRSVFFRSR